MSDRAGLYSDERGDTIQCASGRPFWPLGPCAEDVHLPDILHALSRMPRFGGHALRTYTVLEHEIRGCDLALAEAGLSVDRVEAWAWALSPSAERPTWEQRAVCALALRFLVHDSAEAYIVDVPRPLKVNLPDYRRAERACDAAVLRAVLPSLGWSDEDHADVKRLDNLMLAAERDWLMVAEEDGGLAWDGLPEPPSVDFDAPVWSAADAASCASWEDDYQRAAANHAIADRRYTLMPTHGRTAAAMRTMGLMVRAAEEWGAALLRAAWERRYALLTTALR